MQAKIAKNCGYVALAITVFWIAGDVTTGRFFLFDDDVARQLTYLVLNFARLALAFAIIWVPTQVVRAIIRAARAILKRREA